MQSDLFNHHTTTPQPPMQWQRLLSAVRLGSEDKKAETARSPYHKDYDRLIFSNSFRQLNRKTQVHPLTNHEGIHTRLTHSLEVSCIGRSLGMMTAEKMQADLPDSVTSADIGVIIQAACLAHDIGNPPFGHAGEYAIQDWFNQPKQHELLHQLSPAQRLDLCGFEGNAQGFRVLTRTEYHPNRGGMRLTCATLGAFMKYPWLATESDTSAINQLNQSANQPNKANKFGCFTAEATLLEQAAEALGLIKLANFHYCRHPLTYLLEAADDICYALIDLEDGIHLNMLTYEQVEPLFLAIIGHLGVPSEVTMGAPTSQKLAALRGRAMKRLVDEVSNVFVAKQQRLLAGEPIGSLLQHCPVTINQSIQTAKQLARQKIFNHPDKAKLEIVACQCLHTLLDAFIPLAVNHTPNSFKQQRLKTFIAHKNLQLGENIYHNILLLLDMITNLTDHQAYVLAQQLQGNFQIGL